MLWVFLLACFMWRSRCHSTVWPAESHIYADRTPRNIWGGQEGKKKSSIHLFSLTAWPCSGTKADAGACPSCHCFRQVTSPSEGHTDKQLSQIRNQRNIIIWTLWWNVSSWRKLTHTQGEHAPNEIRITISQSEVTALTANITVWQFKYTSNHSFILNCERADF